MKKLLWLIIPLLFIAALPPLLPMPLMTSGMVGQYLLGDTITIHLSVWNASPLTRTPSGDNPTDVVLLVGDRPIVTTPTDVAPTLSPYSRAERTVSYKISTKNVEAARYNEATNEIELPQGRHNLSVRWLGATSWSSNVAFLRV